MPARAPLRISFAGGGTDIDEYARAFGGCCLNAVIRRYAYCSQDSSFSMTNPTGETGTALLEAVAKRLKAKGKIRARVEVPPLSGLGASAAIAVAAVGALRPEIGKEKAVEVAYQAERTDLGVLGGWQDQVATAWGGINYMEFGADRIKVEPMKVSRETILDLEKHLLLVFVQARTGVRNGGDVISDQLERLKRKENLWAHHRIKEICLDMRWALRHHNMDLFAQLLDEEWKVKRQFSPLISNEYIDGVYEYARRYGAKGGKLMGAGAGGHLLLYCPDAEDIVASKLREIGLHPEQVSFDWEGLVTWT